MTVASTAKRRRRQLRQGKRDRSKAMSSARATAEAKVGKKVKGKK